MTEAPASPAEMVRGLWAAFDRFAFAEAGELLHDDFVCEWPQSGERIRGRENFVALNASYPGRWRCTIERLVVEGEHIAADVALESDGVRARAVSFYEMRDGRIVREVDYWPEAYPAPAWRARWVERINDGEE